MAMTIVEQSGGQYHVLLIIADGQVICFYQSISLSEFKTRTITNSTLAQINFNFSCIVHELVGFSFWLSYLSVLQLYILTVISVSVQVTRSVDTGRGQLSPQEQKTVDAIVQARYLPLVSLC